MDISVTRARIAIYRIMFVSKRTTKTKPEVFRMRLALLVLLSTAIPATIYAQALNIPWSGYAHDPRHTTLANSDPNVTQVSLNCAPALSVAQNIVYVAVSGGTEYGQNGYLVSMNAAKLAPIAHVQLFDPRGGRATVSGDSSAAPMVGPDGDVYYGVLENPCCSSHNDRGWMLHFNSTLGTLKAPGSLGWDNTPSVVPAADPNGSMQDEYSTSPVTVPAGLAAIVAWRRMRVC